jgi:CheY-like chemotaxis protein
LEDLEFSRRHNPQHFEARSAPGTAPTLRRLKTGIRFLGVEEPPVRILVVEDDPLVRELVVEALREEGYDVIHASNGEEALAWCKQRVPDVLVTDIKLPGPVDGWQIAEHCREHDPGLAVIYATGFSPVAARPVPGSLSLQKPYHPEQMVHALPPIDEPLATHGPHPWHRCAGGGAVHSFKIGSDRT